MDNIQKELEEYTNQILSFRIPRWEELPDIDLYMDQLITFIEQHFSNWSYSSEESIITPSMVNNYVKLNLIPRPINKRYNKTHLAYLFVISILKHIFTIQDIRDGILFQTQIDGEKLAYNSFCEEQERAIQFVANSIIPSDKVNLRELYSTSQNLTIKMATLSFATKIFCQKSIELQKEFMKKNIS